ncbi:hypothetical protein Nepgr_016862 [Nepenthes gracilis]|uniref:Phytocyanin domain-containing protein n=1 Tax=Nepenthes gracilis TaxID=150966 RepID=A0AAD3SRF9_NEPGR|nr:hypothetical protein Nepgr_016862 [Nepenthes gracilis]
MEADFNEDCESRLFLVLHWCVEMNSTSCSRLILLIFAILSSLHHFSSSASAFELDVGDIKGWAVPPRNDTEFYNNWASENRFRVGDSIRFRYRKDSVMEVTEEDYKKCSTTRPSFFSNTGNNVFQLERSGSFYFISGSSGHCELGQRMIVKVLAQDDDSGRSHAASSGSTAALAPALLSAHFLLSRVASYP